MAEEIRLGNHIPHLTVNMTTGERHFLNIAGDRQRIREGGVFKLTLKTDEFEVTRLMTARMATRVVEGLLDVLSETSVTGAR